MKIDLAPYNYYILYAMIIVTIIFLLVTLIKMLKSVKAALDVIQPDLESIQKNVQLMQIKSEVIEEKTAEDKKRIEPLFKALPILWAIRTIYKKSDDLQGVEGMAKAAKTYANQQQAEKKIIKAVVKEIAK